MCSNDEWFPMIFNVVLLGRERGRERENNQQEYWCKEWVLTVGFKVSTRQNWFCWDGGGSNCRRPREGRSGDIWDWLSINYKHLFYLVPRFVEPFREADDSQIELFQLFLGWGWVGGGKEHLIYFFNFILLLKKSVFILQEKILGWKRVYDWQ